MGHTFYTEYVTHCLRFYTRYEEPTFRTQVDKANWEACQKAFENFSDNDKATLKAIFSGGDTIPDNIYQMSKKSGASQESLWLIVSKLERDVAKLRGLLE